MNLFTTCMYDKKHPTGFSYLFICFPAWFFIETFLHNLHILQFFLLLFMTLFTYMYPVCITKKPTEQVSHIYLFVFQDGSYLAEFLIKKGYEVLFNLQDVGCILY